MLKQINDKAIRVVLAAAIVSGMSWGNASGAMTFNGTHENGRYLNGVSVNGVWQNGVWQNGIWQNGIWQNGIMNNGAATNDRYPNTAHVPGADTALHPSSACLSEPDRCGVDSPEAEPSGASVRSVTLPDGTFVTVE